MRFQDLIPGSKRLILDPWSCGCHWTYLFYTETFEKCRQLLFRYFCYISTPSSLRTYFVPSLHLSFLRIFCCLSTVKGGRGQPYSFRRLRPKFLTIVGTWFLGGTRRQLLRGTSFEEPELSWCWQVLINRDETGVLSAEGPSSPGTYCILYIYGQNGIFLLLRNINYYKLISYIQINIYCCILCSYAVYVEQKVTHVHVWSSRISRGIILVNPCRYHVTQFPER